MSKELEEKKYNNYNNSDENILGSIKRGNNVITITKFGDISNYGLDIGSKFKVLTCNERGNYN